MARSIASLNKRKRELKSRLLKHLDFLRGSVVAYRLKCGKHCQCNAGQKHLCFYLSVRTAGKTRNRYLSKDTVDSARRMTREHQKVKQLLDQIADVNYQLLRARGAGGRKGKP